MNHLIAADAWMHNVLSYKTPLDVCKRRFQEFTLEQDIFIKDEIQNGVIPDLEKRGYEDAVEAYKKILVVLEYIIADKQ